jgi:hypothetical protein
MAHHSQRAEQLTHLGDIALTYGSSEANAIVKCREGEQNIAKWLLREISRELKRCLASPAFPAAAFQQVKSFNIQTYNSSTGIMPGSCGPNEVQEPL